MIRDRRAILALLTALNFINYIDRAVIAAVLKPMRGELALSNFEAGLLNTAFLIGYFVTSPWFGARADKSARMGLIALGVVIWSVATVASGLASGFWSLLAARIVVGVGEASFTVLAPTVIDDLMPAGNKGKALAVFFLAIPLGYAMGYILGGSIAHHWGWRTAFVFVGGPGVVLALTCLLIAEPARKLLDARARLVDGLREMIGIPLFRRAVLGYCAYVAAVAGFSYWAPNFLLERFPGRLNDETANFWFGVVLIAAGAIGTFAGGQWTDRGQRALPAAAADAPYDAPESKAAVNVALRVCAAGMAVAAPLAALCFVLPSPMVFFVVAFVVEIGVFLSTSPINLAIMRAVPVERRASAVAASVFAIHLFGDLWSSAALGLLQDVLPIIIAMMAIPLTFAWSAYIWWPREREAAGTGGPPQAQVRPAT
ncbi:MAG TPA: MFS transporter [Kofleriaceae bacterium]|nr:MFS transporter [Kofleriaceae bacterium]